MGAGYEAGGDMKIVHIIPSLSAAGAEILMANMAITAAQKGHQVLICCLYPHDKSWEKLPLAAELMQWCQIEVLNEQISFRFLRAPLLNNVRYTQCVEAFKPDVIHSHLFVSELMAHSYHVNNVRYVSHGHDNMVQLQKFSGSSLLNKVRLTNLWERFWLIKRYLRVKPVFIAISKDVEAYFHKVLPRGAFQILHLPNAIRTRSFKTDRRTSEPHFGRFKLVSVASLVPKKNHTYLIDVVKVLHDRGFDIEAEVLGDGPLMNALRDKVDALGLKGRFFFRGSVGDVPQRLWNAHLYVHPAWYEPFGLVLLEAMASGLPVVSLDGYGNRELMKDGQNGYLIPTKALPEEFADKIQFFIDNPDERIRQGAWATDFANAYDIDRYAENLLRIYRS